MAPNTRTTCFDARLLRGLVGTTINTYDLVSDGAALESTSQTWVITEKLSDRAAPMTDHDVKMGRGSAKTVGKFLCPLVGDPNQTAFMRIYQQIPITGTEDANHDTLAKQVVPPGVCGELESFKLFRRGRCNAVPRFLGHTESTQEENGLVPGG